MKKINQHALTQFEDSLHYLHMSELKEICRKLNLPSTAKKKGLIKYIMAYLQEKKVAPLPQIPEVSKARKNVNYPLSPKTPMLYGSYKNDAATRAFLKNLIGSHFHFTVYGQDWIKERWAIGKPPTYAEFVLFWQEEYKNRKTKKSKPKEEWAYINFIQRYFAKYPHAQQQEMVSAWQEERLRHVQQVYKLLQDYI